jgi:hypothetical protein
VALGDGCLRTEQAGTDQRSHNEVVEQASKHDLERASDEMTTVPPQFVSRH